MHFTLTRFTVKMESCLCSRILIEFCLILTFLTNSLYSLTNTEVNNLLTQRYDVKDSMRQHNGGKFMIGINDPKSTTGEYPVRSTSVKPFYMDTYPVTVAQFWKYKLKKPRYRTTAEKEGFSWAFSRLLSLHVRQHWSSESADPWWLAVRGATWNSPEGSGTHVRDRLDYPVVHVSFHDAKAYCQWVGKRLPTEEEWEFAARGNLAGLQYPWGDKFRKGRMNVWQGKFPEEDKGFDGWKGLSPVDAYPTQNNFSMYDMLGNVWEWTTSRYYERVIDRKLQDTRYVLKGGSYLDTRDGTFNHAVRTANRMGQEPKYSAHNVGFRCAASAPHLHRQQKEKDPRYRANKNASSTRPQRLPRRKDNLKANMGKRKYGSKRRDEL